tara:strand:+ start:120 stop:707 length:588 start_codon:yes stop_codon:yes gene_type:complete
MDDYDEDKQWEKAGKQGNKIRTNIAKDLNKNPLLKILDDITPELYPDDDSDTSRWRYHSGSDDLERHNYLKKELKNMSTKEKNALLKRYAKNPNTLLKRPLSNLAARTSAINDNIMKATNRMGAPLGMAAAAGEAAKMKAAQKGLGFLMNPYLAALMGLFAPTEMGDGTLYSPEEMQKMYEHRQRELALSGPLAF